MDILGNVVEEAGLGQEMGEPDCTCVPVPGTLTPSAPTRHHSAGAADHG
jgi:gamma-glutamylputrescine synthase